MAIPTNTGTILDRNGKDMTSVGLSTNIIIMVDDKAVGGITSLQIGESRNISMIDEVGTDGHVDSAPSKATDIKGSAKRTRLNKMRVAEAFGRQFLHVHSQRIPFDIVIKDVFAGSDDASTVITTIKNVWISNISYTYESGNFIIAEDMQWEAETIYTTLGASSNSAVLGGLQGQKPVYTNSIEVSADTGGRRGALDAAGLLNAMYGTTE
jgi:hypothetical protein